MVHRVEEVVAATPEVAGFARRTGAELGLFATEQNRGDIVVKLKPQSARKRNAEQIIEEQRAAFAEQMPGMTIEFVQLLQDMLGDLEGNPEPVEVKIFGDDLGQLGRARGPHGGAPEEDPRPRRPRRAPARQPRGGRAHRPHAGGAGGLHGRAGGEPALGGPARPGGHVLPARGPPDRRAGAVPRRAALRPRLDPGVPADHGLGRDRAPLDDVHDRARPGGDAAVPRGPEADGPGDGPPGGPGPRQRRARRRRRRFAPTPGRSAPRTASAASSRASRPRSAR